MKVRFFLVSILSSFFFLLFEFDSIGLTGLAADWLTRRFPLSFFFSGPIFIPFEG